MCVCNPESNSHTEKRSDRQMERKVQHEQNRNKLECEYNTTNPEVGEQSLHMNENGTHFRMRWRSFFLLLLLVLLPRDVGEICARSWAVVKLESSEKLEPYA